MCKRTAGKYVHKYEKAGFYRVLREAYGENSVAEKAYTYLCDHMNKENGFIRKFSGEDYFIHPQAVAELLMNKTGADEVRVAVALLHDCIEDLPEGTDGEIMALFGPEITHKVRLLTKNWELDYDDQNNMCAYLSDILTDEDATLVKIGDRMNNNSTLSSAKPEKRADKTEETRRYFVPLAEKAMLKFPENAEFYREAAVFFALDID
ncbi:MAG: HD domain-containing protein [Clostridia bacterium]|nr:HD domain-containing protein [Clostridia bacterium]